METDLTICRTHQNEQKVVHSSPVRRAKDPYRWQRLLLSSPSSQQWQDVECILEPLAIGKSRDLTYNLLSHKSKACWSLESYLVDGR